MHSPVNVQFSEGNCGWRMRCVDSCGNSKYPECHRHDHSEQFYLLLQARRQWRPWRLHRRSVWFHSTLRRDSPRGLCRWSATIMPAKTKHAVEFSAKLSISFMMAARLVYHYGAKFIVSLFMKNEIVVAYGSRFLCGFSLALPFLSLDFFVVGVFTVCGMGRRTLVLQSCEKLSWKYPPYFFWIDFSRSMVYRMHSLRQN